MGLINGVDVEALKRLDTTLRGGPPTGAIHEVLDQLPAIIVALKRGEEAKQWADKLASDLENLIAIQTPVTARLKRAERIEAAAKTCLDDDDHPEERYEEHCLAWTLHFPDGAPSEEADKEWDAVCPCLWCAHRRELRTVLEEKP